LDHAVKVTQSKIGFFHFVSPDEKTIILTTWNKQALKTCKANYTSHYPIEKAGNWADCVRLKHPVIYNHFLKSPNQKGLPIGHTEISRILSFPLIENNHVIAIFGVGNKEEPYVQDDVLQLELVSSELNKIIKQKRSEEEVLESKENYRSLFENMLDGFAYCKMIFNDESAPIDFVYLEVNSAFEKLTGLKRENVIGKKVTIAIPGIKEANPELFDIYGRVASTGKKEKF
jgi:PAS domain-containing protein